MAIPVGGASDERRPMVNALHGAGGSLVTLGGGGAVPQNARLESSCSAEAVSADGPRQNAHSSTRHRNVPVA